MNRRKFINKTLATGAAVSISSATAFAGDRTSVKILGISCSPRKGKTTATAVQAALDAAKKVDGHIEVELLDLGGLEILGWSGGAKPNEAQQITDDFDLILPKLRDPDVGGWIIGSPSYFRSMSALCKAFLERLAVLRSPKLLLADKPVGVLAVGAYRNGGQELVIEQIQAAMLCHEVMVVGGKPGAHQGATLWNAYKDDITKDEFGMDTAGKLGIRVAEAALRLALRKP
ncbi:MAG: flavodoxin family protein [Planctomycetes bacterium]|nr:flavodoxin family protein [Planctomycetota bacterium]MBL7142968.1 flavodoxin family protein [Phycisphaerae bacterium]